MGKKYTVKTVVELVKQDKKKYSCEDCCFEHDVNLGRNHPEDPCRICVRICGNMPNMIFDKKIYLVGYE